MDSPSRRSPSLQVQLALAFAVVALLSVGVVAFWARQITAWQIAAYHERIRRGEVSWLLDQPRPVREGFVRGVKPALFAASQRVFLANFNRSLWLAGGTAGLLAVVAGVILARRLSRPLRDLHDAVVAVAAGHLDRELRLHGGGELEAVAAAFNRMARRLRESERQRRELLAAIAHELRTPLAIIEGNLEAILDGVREPTPDLVAMLHTQSALLNQLITDLRDLTLADAGQLQLHRCPVDLADLCRESVEAMALWIGERQVRVDVRTAGDTTADVDPARMRQVVQNLLHNAVRFTPPGGQVTMTVGDGVRADRRWVTLVVDDEGPGIPPADLDHVFEPFYRADPSRSRATGGSGLGLAVVKRLVEVHGGEVSVENRPGGGSRFTVRLPARAS
ncbi:MAG: ATP-binding protein [Armatimonadota bacterium]|nr:ATP-binding protein [Armatimonadota bacterium]MDR7404457.1 ATP-binding protein [Armatimonadota bacterium]